MTRDTDQGDEKGTFQDRRTGLANLEARLLVSGAQGRVRCERRQEELMLSVDGQIIGVWRQRREELALFRPGLDGPECVASGPSEAAKLTERLINAFAQA